MPTVPKSRKKVEALHAANESEEHIAAQEQQTGVQRPVMAFMPGKISSNKYEQRVDNCTKEQLSLLLTSSEYQHWQQGRQPAKAWSWTPSPEALFGIVLLVVIPFVLVTPYYLTQSNQEVTAA